MKEYKKGIYKVTVAKDGAIKVKQNDWISKYSAAIYNDFTKLGQFARMVNGNALPTVIKSPDDIFTGETIYHIDSYWGQHKSTTPRPKKASPPAQRKLTPQEKQIIIETLKHDFNLKGENLKTITKVIDNIGYTDNALALIELTGLIKGAAFATAASTISFLSTLAFPVASFGMLLNVNESGLKMYGLRAVAYTTTAWAFDKPIPTGSNRILARIKGLPTSTIIKNKQTWLNVSRATVKSLNAEALKRNTSEANLKLLYRALSDNNPRTLCHLLMEELTSKLDTIQKINWDLKTLYPD